MNVACAPRAESSTDTGLVQVFVEYLRHPDNCFFVGLLAATVAWLLTDGAQLSDLCWFALGWLFFLPQEYFTHTLLLHRRLPKSGHAYRWFYRLHYGHHDFPRRHDLMYMPAWLTVPMTACNVLLLGLITPTPHAHAAMFIGVLWGYLLYEWCHLLFHTPYQPRSALWRKLRQNHLMHHHYDEHRWFAVAPLSVAMDWVMNTGKGSSKVPRSRTCRYLGLSPDHEWLADAREKFAHRSSGSLEASRLWLTNVPSVERQTPTGGNRL